MVKLIVKLVNLTVQYDYCKFGNFHEGFILRSFVKMKSSGNREITLSITDIVKSCPNSECFNVANLSLTLFAKIKFSRKFPDLQYAKGQLNKAASQRSSRPGITMPT